MNAKRVEVAGSDYLALATSLLRETRMADPLAGIWEAADLHWWWRKPRASDAVRQTFWVDDRGPLAAVVFTEWAESWACDPLIVDATDDRLRSAVWDTAHQRLMELHLGQVDVAVRTDDTFLPTLLVAAGFELTDEVRDTTAWMDADEVPVMPPLPDGYRIVDRTYVDGVHHLVARNGPVVEERLRQTAMYDPELDLAVRDPKGEVVAYGLFWFDPVTLVGLVEPMRTEESHQRKGLARAVLLAGLQQLVARGAQRLKVSYTTNAAGALYRSVGFKPESETHTYSGTF